MRKNIHLQTAVSSEEETYTLPAIEEGGNYIISYGFNGGVMVSARDRRNDGFASTPSSFFSKEVDMIKAMVGYLSFGDMEELREFIEDRQPPTSEQSVAEFGNLAAKVQAAR